MAFDANILPAVLNVMATGDAKSKKEATWAVANACSGGSPSAAWLASRIASS